MEAIFKEEDFNGVVEESGNSGSKKIQSYFNFDLKFMTAFLAAVFCLCMQGFFDYEFLVIAVGTLSIPLIIAVYMTKVALAVNTVSDLKKHKGDSGVIQRTILIVLLSVMSIICASYGIIGHFIQCSPDEIKAQATNTVYSENSHIKQEIENKKVELANKKSERAVNNASLQQLNSSLAQVEGRVKNSYLNQVASLSRENKQLFTDILNLENEIKIAEKGYNTEINTKLANINNQDFSKDIRVVREGLQKYILQLANFGIKINPFGIIMFFAVIVPIFLELGIYLLIGYLMGMRERIINAQEFRAIDFAIEHEKALSKLKLEEEKNRVDRHILKKNFDVVKGSIDDFNNMLTKNAKKMKNLGIDEDIL